ncbi:MAG: hypothetical protein H7Y42_12875 [Chitinophagaceae bacterium]|nr:hypothetical protein [Chitinophagaceae bacterium]
MTQRDSILQELSELQSSLSAATIQPVYTVPEGYFDGLAEQVVRRIKALEATNAADELRALSPLLYSIDRVMPYSIPTGFFESIEPTAALQASDIQTPEEELAGLSPLLSGLNKAMPYSVPEGYFQDVKPVPHAEGKPVTKVISLSKRGWLRYAAAAIVTSVIALSGFLIISKGNAIDPNEKPYAWVEKNLKKVNTDAIDEFAALADNGSMASVDTKTALKESNEVKDLIKDIPVDDIQEFLLETEASETEVEAGESLLN